MRRLQSLSCLVFLVLVCGCPSATQESSPFLTFMEEFGVLGTTEEPETGAGQGLGLEVPFRRDVTVTFRNNHPQAELNVLLLAWVKVSSIRSADQQDALFRGGYLQLSRETRLGSVFTLPVGTFVYGGSGTAGATAIVLGPAEGDGGGAGAVPTSKAITLITPDVVLAFAQPPVSCDSVAFFFTQNGEPLTSAHPFPDPEAPYSGSTREGGYKTLAQVDLYQCDPLRPGLFLSQGGAAQQSNEYLEGEDIAFDFNAVPDPDGNFCIVTIGQPVTTGEP